MNRLSTVISVLSDNKALEHGKLVLQIPKWLLCSFWQHTKAALQFCNMHNKLWVLFGITLKGWFTYWQNIFFHCTTLLFFLCVLIALVFFPILLPTFFKAETRSVWTGPYCTFSRELSLVHAGLQRLKSGVQICQQWVKACDEAGLMITLHRWRLAPASQCFLLLLCLTHTAAVIAEQHKQHQIQNAIRHY